MTSGREVALSLLARLEEPAHTVALSCLIAAEAASSESEAPSNLETFAKVLVWTFRSTRFWEVFRGEQLREYFDDGTNDETPTSCPVKDGADPRPFLRRHEGYWFAESQEQFQNADAAWLLRSLDDLDADRGGAPR